MRKQLLPENVDFTVIAAFGGLTVISSFVIFFEKYWMLLILVALVLSSLGLLSLKQMDTQQGRKSVKK